MSKTAELIRLITVIILATILAGVAGYFTPRIGQLMMGEPIQWGLTAEKGARENSFGEQAELQRQYAKALQQDIVRLIERTTGAGTVSATVQVDLNLTRETVHQKDVIPTDDSFEGSALSPEQDTFVFERAGLPDISVTKSWIQSTAGVVQRLSVSVLIDGQVVRDADGQTLYQPRTRAEMENYTTLIKAIIGFEEERGDTLEVLNLPFSDEGRALWGIRPAAWVQGMCLLALLIVVLWLGVGFILPVMRRLVTVDPVRPTTPPKAGRSSLEKVSLICKQSPERAVQLLVAQLHQKSTKSKGYTAAQQAAVIFLALGDGMMRDLFHHMDESDIRLLGQVMGSLGPVRAEDVQSCLDTFLQAVSTPAGVTGSGERVRDVLDNTLPKETGERLYSEIRLASGGQTVWSRLNTLDTGVLVPFLGEQKPETAALILYHLSDTVSAKVMGLLPNEAATRIMIHLAHLRHIRADVRQKLERDIAVRVCDLIQQARTQSGAEKASAILRAMDKQDEAGLMQSVSAEEPGAADEVAVWMMDFDDLAKWPDADIHVLLKYIDRQVAALALHDAPMAVRDAFVRNMPAAVWMSLNREMERLTPEKLRGKKAARQTVVKTARELIKLNKTTIK